MKTFETIECAGADGIVHLAVPVEEPNRSYRVLVMVEPALEKPAPPMSVWPPGFFEATEGKWVGEFERPPQGEYEKREEL